MKKELFADIKEGLLSGVPIALGYAAVAFSLGISAGGNGISPFQGWLASFLNHASAGEYALFSAIAVGAPYIEVLLVTLIANARYLLLGFAMAAKLPNSYGTGKRLLVGFCVTDEIFAVTVGRERKATLPFIISLFSLPVLFWSLSDAIGIAAGNILPAAVISALGVSLYGMFLAIVIPPAKKSLPVTLAVLLGFIFSFAFSRLLPALTEGTRVIILTVVISVFLALLFPLKDEEEEK